MPEWNDEIRASVVKQYVDQNPTPETSTEIVKAIATELGDDYTPNGVMAILIKAGKYIKKTPQTGAKTNGASKGTRVSKADAINDLSELIEAAGLEADGDILGKLTGKAAVYFKEVFEKVSEQD